ncbi:unannotated protein [freshwater metagenome]|uniref:Unannotated protein n=1 Tax=freshwater metagenome TaxID=449393 RepID=A0A6J7EFT6_9ZZZZ
MKPIPPAPRVIARTAPIAAHLERHNSDIRNLLALNAPTKESVKRRGQI